MGGEQHRGPALVHLTHALERLGASAEQSAELPAQLRMPQRLALDGENLAKCLRRKERRQDQVDETALVALAAPVRQTAGRIRIEGLITTTERAVVSV